MIAGAQVGFRVDASVRIGTGHVMRCLTLADALRERGANCHFVCRAHPGHLIDLVASRGHAVTALAPPAESPGDLAHSAWLGADWASDAAQTVDALPGPLDALVVDHYALDHRWESVLRRRARRIMVIDDIADRRHDCDLLLDQNLGRTAADYDRLTPVDTPRMIGPHFALLRPEFATARPASLSRRANPALRHLLITLGGVDADNTTGAILTALADCDLPDLTSIEVILGSGAPWVAEVRAQAATMPWPTQVRAGVTDMAATMTRADLAIGAAGGTSWERCCLGLPTILIVLADNQKEAAAALQAAGAVCTLRADSIARDLAALLADLTPASLAALSHEGARICDGRGAARAADRILLLLEAA